MKQVSALGLGLAAICLIFVTILAGPAKPVTATEPTVTPTGVLALSPPTQPPEPLCYLKDNEDCFLVNPVELTEVPATTYLNPTIGASAVPTYTLISVTFDREIDPATLHPDSFYLTQAGQRLSGTIRYLPPSRMAVFSPTLPLQTATRYTATLTGAVRTPYGEPIPTGYEWSFTTRPANGLSALTAAGMQIYFGDLHSHTGYSDGVATPEEAFFTARAAGVDFFAVTEHGFMLDDNEWQALQAQAQAATQPGQFVALPGFEYTHLYGHLNVFDSDTRVSRDDPNYDTLAEFYAWLVAHPTAFAQFNHPKVNEFIDWNFNDFAFNPAADQKIVLQELEMADQFFLSLNQGWHLGTLKNSDTHQGNWGCCPLMGVVAPELTTNAILDSLRARRTFFVSPSDNNFALTLQANGTWMGSALPYTPQVTFTITGHDPDPPSGKSLRMRLYDNGLLVAETELPASATPTWSPTIPVSLGHYYYAEAFYSGWFYPAYSSPVWLEQTPQAEAGQPQVVAPGAMVILDGTGSSDPDGAVLAYQWGQESGAPVSLAQPRSSQPSFIAPAQPGDLTFRLTVVDTGSLTASDTTLVTVTAKPLLTINKNGPRRTNPGEPITYVLTVVNNGIQDATNVVVTDEIPSGATYVSGGTRQGNQVTWTVPVIPANGGTVEVSFVVTAQGGIVNSNYGATCPDCIPAVGQVAVFTNEWRIHLPLVTKS